MIQVDWKSDGHVDSSVIAVHLKIKFRLSHWSQNNKKCNQSRKGLGIILSSLLRQHLQAVYPPTQDFGFNFLPPACNENYSESHTGVQNSRVAKNALRKNAPCNRQRDFDGHLNPQWNEECEVISPNNKDVLQLWSGCGKYMVVKLIVKEQERIDETE